MGFPKENRQRLLEPYMTTRAEGTGLGLPIVAKILADHGGGLELRDAPGGRGAWVRMFFPLGHDHGGHDPGEQDLDRAVENIMPAEAKRGGMKDFMASDILIVDDEADIREIVSGILSDEGHGTRTAKNSDEALAAIGARRPTLVFLDIWLQGSRLDGLQLLKIIKEQNPALPVVMISGHGNIETAVSAIKLGAYDFIEKPFKADRLVLVAERALEASRLKREVTELRTRAGRSNKIVGKSTAINQLRQVIERVGPANSRVLITGAPGAGKELAARSIHDASARANGPFVTINSATIAPETMEMELFGVEAKEGSGRKVGALEEAHGGTLYLDEIADMPKETQGKILRVLVEQNFLRVGGATRVHVDVRIISSSSRDLPKLIADGAFREDLFHRLAVVPVRVPSVSEHREDIAELDRLFHGAAFDDDRHAQACDRRRRHGGSAIA